MASKFNRMNLLVAIFSLIGVLYLFNSDLAYGIALPCEHNQRF